MMTKDSDATVSCPLKHEYYEEGSSAEARRLSPPQDGHMNARTAAVGGGGLWFSPVLAEAKLKYYLMKDYLVRSYIEMLSHGCFAARTLERKERAVRSVLCVVCTISCAILCMHCCLIGHCGL